MQYAAVIFDLFGTLVPDVQSGVYSGMAQRLGLAPKVFGLHWAKRYMQRTAGRISSEESLRELNNELGLALPPQVYSDVAELRAAGVRRVFASGGNEALALLRNLGELGIRRALLSNASEPTPSLWPACPLATEIDAAVFSCEVGFMKPQREIYLLACERLGVLPEQCLFVGDGGDDELQGAADVGMTPLQLRTTRPRQAGAHAVVAGLPDVLRFLGLDVGSDNASLATEG